MRRTRLPEDMVTLDASTLHDALRAEGLVPESEDVHLLACSNRWRHAIERIETALGFPDVDELQSEIDSLEGDVEDAKADAAGYSSQLEEVKAELSEAEAAGAKAEAERDRALEHAVELEAELAKVRAAE